MIKNALLALSLLGLATPAFAQKIEKAEIKTAQAESDPKAIEFLGQVDQKMYSLQAAGAKDVKVVMSSPQLNEQLAGFLGDVDLKFVLLWKGGKEKMQVEGLPDGMEAMEGQLSENLASPGRLAVGRPLVEKAKDYTVSMEKDGDLTMITMVANKADTQTQKEIIWYDANFLPVRTEQTQESPFGGEATVMATLKLKKIQLEDKSERYVMESITQKGDMGEQDVKLTYKKTANGFHVLEKLETANGGQEITLQFDVTVNQGIKDSEFSG